jgi:hypothetical protein
MHSMQKSAGSLLMPVPVMETDSLSIKNINRKGKCRSRHRQRYYTTGASFGK